MYQMRHPSFVTLQLKWAKFGKQILAMRDEPNVDLRC